MFTLLAPHAHNACIYNESDVLSIMRTSKTASLSKVIIIINTDIMTNIYFMIAVNNIFAAYTRNSADIITVHTIQN